MASIMTGARAKVYVDSVLVGMFDSVSYGANIGAETIHTLGRFGAHKNEITSYEAVQVQCSGFRIIGQGVNVLPKFPKLDDLLEWQDVTLSLTDRKTGQNIMTVVGCVPVSYGTGHQAKSTSKISISYLGIKLEEESGDQTEDNADADKAPTALPEGD